MWLSVKKQEPVGRIAGRHDTGELVDIYTAYQCIENGAEKPKKADVKGAKSGDLHWDEEKGMFVSG